MPHKTLSLVTREGDYFQMAQSRKDIYQNLISVPSTYGTGLDVHLGLGMNPAQYMICAGVLFKVPADPGSYDLTIPANAGVTVKACREAMHQDARHKYTVYVAVNAVIKNQLNKPNRQSWQKCRTKPSV